MVCMPHATALPWDLLVSHVCVCVCLSHICAASSNSLSASGSLGFGGQLAAGHNKEQLAGIVGGCWRPMASYGVITVTLARLSLSSPPTPLSLPAPAREEHGSRSLYNLSHRRPKTPCHENIWGGGRWKERVRAATGAFVLLVVPQKKAHDNYSHCTLVGSRQLALARE